MHRTPYHLFESKILQMVIALILGLILQNYYTQGLFYTWGLSLLLFIIYVLNPFKTRIRTLLRILLFYALSLSTGTSLLYRYQQEMTYILPKQVSEIHLKRMEKQGMKSSRYLGEIEGKPILVQWHKQEKIHLPAKLRGVFDLRPIEHYDQAFDYKKFNYWKGIKYQVHVYQRDPIEENIENRAWYEAYRFSLMETLERKVRDTQVLGVIKALLFGDKSGLDREIQERFQQVGLIHVLAISGLHLGIFIWLIQLVVARWPKHIRFINIFSLGLQLGCLWFFVYLSGSSTSVIRAALMFSILVLGRQFQWQLLAADFLAFSALIILFWSPNQLFQLGFQLSFLAVLGILFYYPLLQIDLKKHPKKRTKMFLGVWNFMAIGLAAQSLLWPLLLFYFGQIPYFFWLYNLLIIPLITLLLYLLLPLCFGMMFTPLGDVLIYLGIQLINTIFHLIYFLQQWYDDVFKWRLNEWQVLCINMLMLMLPAYFKSYRLFNWIYVFLLIFLCIIIHFELQGISSQ